MTFTCTAAPFSQPLTVVEAAAKPRLNKKKVTLTPGKTCKLKVKGGKAKKWKSSKKKVATVSKTGKVTAKKAGKAMISTKVGKRTLKCIVTVKAKKIKQPDTESKKPIQDNYKVDDPSVRSDDYRDYPYYIEYNLGVKTGTYKESILSTYDSGGDNIIHTLNDDNTYTYVVTLDTRKYKYNPYYLMVSAVNYTNDQIGYNSLNNTYYDTSKLKPYVIQRLQDVTISKAKNPDGSPDINNDDDWDYSMSCWEIIKFDTGTSVCYKDNRAGFRNQIFRFEFTFKSDSTTVDAFLAGPDTIRENPSDNNSKERLDLSKVRTTNKGSYYVWKPDLSIRYEPVERRSMGSPVTTTTEKVAISPTVYMGRPIPDFKLEGCYLRKPNN